MNIEHQGLTPEEEVHYANYAWIDVCECCGEWTPIQKSQDNLNYLTWTFEGKLYCQKCLK